jgi:hypothetical protein
MLIRFARVYAWADDSMVLHDTMSARDMAGQAWCAVEHCLCQALAALGYDLHAEQPLAKVIPESLTGRRMMQGRFGDLCKAAQEADPVGDFVRELMEWGISETQLANLLKTQPTLPDPFKNAIRNKYRTIRLTNP